MRVLLNQKGMTLVEVLVALALVGLVITGLMSVYWCAAFSFDREEALADAQYSARLVKQKIITDVRESVNIDDKNNRPVIEVQKLNGAGVGLNTEGPQLYIEKLGDSGDKLMILYYVDNTKLYREKRRSINTAPFFQLLDKKVVTDEEIEVAFNKLSTDFVQVNIQSPNESDKIYEITTQSARRIE